MANLLAQLGIQHPIFLAPMAGISTPELAANVSNLGGLGSLGLGACNVDAARQQILATQALTDAPFQLNFFCHHPEALNHEIAQTWINYLAPHFQRFGSQPPQQLNAPYRSFLEQDDYLALVLETHPKAVSFHFGIPHAYQLKALKDAGILTMVSATNLPEALAIEQAGIDVIIAQGIEAGGHRGMFNPTTDSAMNTADLVRLIHQRCNIPVVAAGGIMNGHQAQDMLELGAAAVQLGTAFVTCPSSNTSATHRQALLQKPITQISACISGRPARGIINKWHTQVDVPDHPAIPAYPYTYDIAKQLHALAAQHHEQGFATFWAGSNVAQIRELSSIDLMNLLILELNQTSG